MNRSEVQKRSEAGVKSQRFLDPWIRKYRHPGTRQFISIFIRYDVPVAVQNHKLHRATRRLSCSPLAQLSTPPSAMHAPTEPSPFGFTLQVVIAKHSSQSSGSVDDHVPTHLLALALHSVSRQPYLRLSRSILVRALVCQCDRVHPS